VGAVNTAVLGLSGQGAGWRVLCVCVCVCRCVASPLLKSKFCFVYVKRLNVSVLIRRPKLTP
jgi:hypothetical protein